MTEIRMLELVIVGMFNPLKTLSINEGSLIKVGKAAEPLVLLMNSYMKSKCQYSDKVHICRCYGC